MRIIVWILRIIVFLVVLAFALKNTEKVPVYFFGEYAIDNVPLIIVMLVTFVLGLLLGLLIMLMGNMRKQRELNRLKREVAHLEERLEQPDTKRPTVAPEAAAPMAPL
ncbi:MAG TPA: LapA family protein [Paenalcaligenes sp.]|nr:LapA family protein [Paenalcaligenes sp.]